jgi:hypothetical protein
MGEQAALTRFWRRAPSRTSCTEPIELVPRAVNDQRDCLLTRHPRHQQRADVGSFITPNTEGRFLSALGLRSTTLRKVPEVPIGGTLFSHCLIRIGLVTGILIAVSFL